MKKNPFLTFCFACVPGAGQMYYGYMQRGLSLITFFMASFVLGMIFDPLIVIGGIVWMYSFFDTYDLIRYLVAGEPKQDGLLLFGDVEELKKMIPQHSKLLGWGLIGLGVWALYNNFLEPVIANLLYQFGIDAWYVLNRIPSLVVAVLFVLGGLWLLGLRPARRADPLPDYPAPAAAAPQAAPETSAETLEETDALAALRAELDAGVPAAPELPQNDDQ